MRDKKQDYDATIWGPHFWFFINTIAFNYPNTPTDGIKKKYYNFIVSLADFIPHRAIADNFSELLDDHPVEPYLNSRESLLKWVHFIHNKINEKIGKKGFSYFEFIETYVNEYKPKDIKYREKIKQREKIAVSLLTTGLISIILYLLLKQ
mgnify:CR=1 FL=1